MVEQSTACDGNGCVKYEKSTLAKQQTSMLLYLSITAESMLAVGLILR